MEHAAITITIINNKKRTHARTHTHTYTHTHTKKKTILSQNATNNFFCSHHSQFPRYILAASLS